MADRPRCRTTSSPCECSACSITNNKRTKDGIITEEQEMLRDITRDRTSNERPVTEWRKVRSGGNPRAYDKTVYATMAEMGWTGIIIPEEHRGSDFG